MKSIIDSEGSRHCHCCESQKKKKKDLLLMHFLIYNPKNATWRTGSLGWILRRHHPGSDENLSENRYEQEGSTNGFNLAICGRGKSYKWGLALLTDQRGEKQSSWRQKSGL